MQSAGVPANERERLRALAEYQILDTEPEPAFEGLADLTAHILDLPIALISIVDSERQWFKSAHGLGVPEIARDISFCAHVVAEDRELIVRDARVDPRFADNPLVLGDPQVRFYMGVPLRTHDGFVLGTLCAIDQKPRELTEEQQRLLRTIARQVTAQLELRRRNIELEAHHRVQQTLQGQLERSLDEKDVLLQEVHHRVKNNLQLVSSLINLQLALMPEDESRNALEEVQGRIHAVAIVHEAIYGARDYARIPVDNYVRSLASSIFHALEAMSREIALELDIGELQVPVDKAIPCGLVLNELISNAVKHAFPGGRSGTLRIQVGLAPDGRLEMIVADDGVGLPVGFSPEESSSVGMQVVTALAEQLDAELQVERHNGTQWIVRFGVD